MRLPRFVGVVIRLLPSLILFYGGSDLSATSSWKVGIAKIDVSPREPIRLSGYGSRSTPSRERLGKLFARAMVFAPINRPETGSVSVLVTLDAIAVPAWLTRNVSHRLEAEKGIDPAQVAICATHTHAAPHLREALPFLFQQGLSREEADAIDRYSDVLEQSVFDVVLEALENRVPANLDWGVGEVGFAVNRRLIENGQWRGFGENRQGPVDHALPVLRVSNSEGKVMGIFCNYACHCTTMGGGFNASHGDWAGVASSLLEREYADATALIAIGCGADQNPSPRGTLELAVSHGRTLAKEVVRVLKTDLRSLTSPVEAQFNHIPLFLDSPPSPESLSEAATSKDASGRWAQSLLARLAEGKTIPTSIKYPVQTWQFGEELAMVFLAGEVVVDYALALKKRFQSDRLWVNAYANATPSYIASRRLYSEGGYEVDRSMIYYGQPRRLGLDTEDRILDEVTRQLSHSFYSDYTKAVIPSPTERGRALSTIRVPTGFTVDLVAAEPLVQDPVDLAFGPDGILWVVEMADYPDGVDGKPGGRIKALRDLDGDGIYDVSSVFLEGLRYPNSVMPWRHGVLLIAVPNIVFARDVDGDFVADEKEVLFSGFDIGNPQHLAAGLTWGLDNWVHIGHGQGEGGILSHKTGVRMNMNGRDLKINPDTGEMAATSGQTQYRRSRDDYGHWFGSDNSRAGWHYVLSEEILSRNPHFRSPNRTSPLPEVPVAGRVYPSSRTLSRLNDYDRANRFTSVCSLIVYRDRFLGDDFYGNTFVCEPVHNLVSRAVVEEVGPTFRSRRAEMETSSEFFSSTDNWSRPTSVRLGPDGSLYVVDMYRLVIEHPEWIPDDWQRRLRLEDGNDKGRIYRIRPEGKPHEKRPRMDHMSHLELVAKLASENGWVRDMAHQRLLWEEALDVVPELEAMVVSEGNMPSRVQALSVLNGLGQVKEGVLRDCLEAKQPALRESALRISRGLSIEAVELTDLALSLLEDDHDRVRLAAAEYVGNRHSQKASIGLMQCLIAERDPWVRRAAHSSLAAHAAAGITWLIDEQIEMPKESLEALVQTLEGQRRYGLLGRYLHFLSSRREADRALAIVEVLAGLKAPGAGLVAIRDSVSVETWEAISKCVAERIDFLAVHGDRDEKEQELALLCGWFPARRDQDREVLTSQLWGNNSDSAKMAAFDRLAEFGDSVFQELLIPRWRELPLTVQEHGLAQVFRRAEWTLAFLEEASRSQKGADMLRPIKGAKRAWMLKHPSGDIQRLAESLLGRIDEKVVDRLSRLSLGLEMAGRPDEGQTLFVNYCAPCHRVGDVGKDIGPDLLSVSSRSPREFLVGLIDPNRAVEGRYLQHEIRTVSGELWVGLLKENSSEATVLIDPLGMERVIANRDIVSQRQLSQSLMPEGLDEAFDPESLAHLLAYLNENSVSRVLPLDERGALSLTPSSVRVKGRSATVDPATGALSWIDSTDTLLWEVESLPAGEYAIFMDAAVVPSYEGRPFILTVGSQPIRGLVERTGRLNGFRKRKFGNLNVAEPVENLAIEFRHELKSAGLAVREIKLVPSR